MEDSTVSEDRGLIEQIADLAGPVPDVDRAFLQGWQVEFIINTDGTVSDLQLIAPNGE